MLALENSVEGFVNEVLDRLDTGESLFIVDLIWLSVKFDAVYFTNNEVNSLNVNLSAEQIKGRKILAHPHALAQCRQFITQYSLIPTPAPSNSQAVLDLKLDEIALRPHFSDSEQINKAKSSQNIKVFAENVQDYDDARTAFVLLTKIDKKDNDNNSFPNEANHTFWQIVPRYEDKPGTLLQILKLLDNNAVNISSLNSRPLKDNVNESKARRYAFYLILDANYFDSFNALQMLSESDYSVRYLGGWNE